MSSLDKYLSENPDAQPSLRAYMEGLTEEDRNTLVNSAAHVCFAPTSHFKDLLKTVPAGIEPMPDLGDRTLCLCDAGDAAQDVRSEAFSLGKELLEQKKVAILIMAGGQATRLGVSVPKGVYPLDFGDNASCLLEILIHRVSSKGYRVPIIILVSPATEKETTEHLKKHNFFGYPSELIFFCTQCCYPVFSECGKILLSGPLEVFSAPNGNAGFLRALMKADLLTKLRDQGVEFLHIVGVDNPLIPLGDEVTVGFAKLRGLDILNRVVPAHPGKKEGVVGMRKITQKWQAPLINKETLDLCLPEHVPSVLEYSELPEECAIKCANKYANIMNHVMSLTYLEKVAGYIAKTDVEVVPYHIAIKKSSLFDYETKTSVTDPMPSIYKIEHFIFDLFHFCPVDKFGLIVCDRATDFAPIKNATGEDSIETARNAYEARVEASKTK